MKLKTEEELVCGINAVSQIIKTRPSSVHSLFVNNVSNERLNDLVRDATKNKIEIIKEKSSFFEDNFEGCLLYTSPSPRDATLSRMPSSA